MDVKLLIKTTEAAEGLEPEDAERERGVRTRRLESTATACHDF